MSYMQFVVSKKSFEERHDSILKSNVLEIFSLDGQCSLTLNSIDFSLHEIAPNSALQPVLSSMKSD